jgi:hypothetical protein
MTIYTNDVQLYSCFEQLFAAIENHDPKAANALLKADLAIRFNCVSPAAAITIDARRAPVNVLYGPNDVKPIIEIGLTADTLHCLLLGSIRLGKAVGSNLLDMKGPVWKTLALADVFHYAQQFYPPVLEAHNLPTTCPEATRA